MNNISYGSEKRTCIDEIIEEISWVYLLKSNKENQARTFLGFDSIHHNQPQKNLLIQNQKQSKKREKRGTLSQVLPHLSKSKKKKEKKKKRQKKERRKQIIIKNDLVGTNTVRRAHRKEISV